jgi:hypothetical protein
VVVDLATAIAATVKANAAPAKIADPTTVPYTTMANAIVNNTFAIMFDMMCTPLIRGTV